MKNNVLKAHYLLVFLFLGISLFVFKNQKKLTEEELVEIKKIRKYSIISTVYFVITGCAFTISPLFININSLYMFLGILFPGYLLFYIIIYIIGIIELKQGHTFVYPFVGE